MSVLNVISLFGGLAMFLYGMNVMGEGLEKLSGGRLERILEKITSKIFSGVLVGALVTGVIQSSAATTVMVVGFVNAGIMKLTQAVGVIMGANIGTTVTAQILRMGDISSDALFLQILKPQYLSAIVALAGIFLYMFTKSRRKRDVGQILLGFGVLFFGMTVMETAVMRDPAQVENLRNLFTMFSNPVLGVLLGMVVTAVIQSSSASVGILQALSATGAVPFSAAAPIILGQNIGTTITAVLSSVGASRNAKRAALIHVYFNVIGTAVFIAGFYLFGRYIPFWNDPVDRGRIADFHLLFNVVSTLFMLPFAKPLVKLATKSVPDRKSEDDDPEIEMLDPRFLASPSVALDRARDTVVQIAKLDQANLTRATSLLSVFDERKMGRLQDAEAVIDRSEVKLGHYLISLTGRDLTERESAIQSALLHTVIDYERIGDYIVNVAEASPFYGRQTPFSETAAREMEAILNAVGSLMELTLEVFISCDVHLAMQVEPFEEVIDNMTDLLRTRHIERLRTSQCTAENGALFIEILLSLERIADHCSNIAVNIISAYGADGADFDSHAYKESAHRGNYDFNLKYAEYEKAHLEPLRQASN